MKYLLDGYNLLFRAENARGSLEEQRRRLFEKLNFYAETLHLDIAVVLDAHLQIGEMRRHNFHSLEVIYTDFAQTADDFIIEYVESIPLNKRQQIKVVSSDRALVRKVLMERGEATSCAAFFQEMERKMCAQLSGKKKERAPRLPQKTGEKPLPGIHDTKSWTALFESQRKKGEELFP